MGAPAYTFNKNLKAIQQYKPQILGYIKKPDVFEKLKALFPGKFAKAVLESEYKRHSELINHCTTGVVFCVEPDILKELFIKYPWYKHFFLFFPSKEYLNQMFMNFDLTDIIKLPAFKPILGDNELIIEQAIMCNVEKVDVMHNGCRIFAYQPFDKINETQIRTVGNVLKKIAAALHINLNTSVIYGDRILKNDIRSIYQQIKHQTTDILRDKAKGLPVLCIAAGPSLAKQLDFIKAIQNEVYIIAVAAVMKPLLKHGIRADLYTVIDMDDEIEKYFKDIDLTGIKIAIEMSCSYLVMENHPEANFLISQSAADGKSYLRELLDILEIHIPAESRIHGAMTVAMMSVQLANLMGASQIIMAGTDLAYEGAVSHLPGSDSSAPVQIVKNDNGQEFLLMAEYGERRNLMLPIFWEDGWHKTKKCPTTFQFVSYRNFISYFFKTHGLHPINCTEGGLFIPECEHITLQEAYAKYIKQTSISVKKLEVPCKRIINKEKITAGIITIKKIIDGFKEIRDIAKDGLSEMAKDVHSINYAETNEKIKILLSNPYAEYISQNNYAEYYLFKYLELANTTNRLDKLSKNNRNRARLLFSAVNRGLNLFIHEYENMVIKLKEVT